MSQTLHILRKDLKRLRWLLLVWAAVLVARVTFWGLGTRPTEGFAYSFLVEESTGLIGALQLLMLALIAARLVQEEPLVGWDGFWLTRPYSRGALIAAKLLFVAGVLIVLPLIADLWTLTLFHAGVRAQAEAAPTFISGYLTWALLLLTVAAVTPSLGAFVLTIVASVTGLTMLLIALFTAVVFFSEPSRGSSATMPNPIPGLIATLVVDAAALSAIAYQYRHRRWPIAVTVAAVGFVVAMAASVLWASVFGSPAAPDPGRWSRRAAITVDRQWHMELNRRVSMREGQLERLVSARVRLAEMPRNVVMQSAEVNSTLTIPGEAPLVSQPIGGASFPVEDVEWPGQLAATRAALGDITVIRGRNEGNFEFWPGLVSFTGADYTRLAGKQGRLDATLRLNFNGTRLRGVLPLRPGASLDDGVSRVEILKTELGADGLMVAVRRWRAFSPVSPRQAGFLSYVLVNRSRGEALTANDAGSLPMPGANGGSGSFPLSLMGSMIAGLNHDAFSLDASQLRYMSRIVRPGEMRTFDAAWFDGAELAVLETGYVGSVTRTVTIDEFTVPVN